MVRDDVLAALESARGEWISGQVLAERLHVSRAAVWKAIDRLRTEGMKIDAQSGGGYRLLAEDDALTVAAVQAGLRTKELGRALVVLEQVESTNTRIKRDHSTAPHGFTLLADEQLAGRGRMGRLFSSPRGSGLYMSVLLRPALPLEQLHFVTIAAAVAVSCAIEQTCGFAPAVKWVNDVLMHGQKLCGILTEASIEGETGRVEFAVLGIGINLRLDCEALPPDVCAVAGALADFTTCVPRRAVLAAAVLNETERCCDLLAQGKADMLLEEYRGRLCMLQAPICVLDNGATYDAVAQAVDERGHLCVRLADGTERTLSAGEVSIRQSPNVGNVN